MGQRRQVRGLSSALLIVSGLLGWPMPPAKAGGVVPGDPGLVAQASRGSDEPVPAEVEQWQKQVDSLVQQGRHQEAITLREKELAWTEKKLGIDHLGTALSLTNLASLYENQGAYAKAEPLYLRALKIIEKELGPDDPINAQILIFLAFLHHKQGAYDKAEHLYLLDKLQFYIFYQSPKTVMGCE